MKKIPIALGYFTIFFIALYVVFKFVRIPGALYIMLIAGILLSIYFPLLFLRQLEERSNEQPKLVHKFGAFLLGMFIISTIFHFHHWQIVRLDNGQIIPIIQIPPVIGILTYFSISFIFIPWLIFVKYKTESKSLLKNIIGGIGLAFITIGLFGSLSKLPMWQQTFSIGNALLILIYLPWHLWFEKSKGKNIDYLFQVIIIAYLLIVLVYGIFLKWPVTIQDLIRN